MVWESGKCILVPDLGMGLDFLVGNEISCLLSHDMSGDYGMVDSSLVE